MNTHIEAWEYQNGEFTNLVTIDLNAFAESSGLELGDREMLNVKVFERNGESDYEFLVDFIDLDRGHPIAVRTFPDFLQLLRWLAPIIDVAIKSTDYEARREGWVGE